MENNKKAYLILLAGVLFNLSIGVLYTWSILKTKLTASVGDEGWGWSSTEAGLPYTIAIIFFAIGLLVGGRIQDKIGPRWIITAGGVFIGLGMILSGLVGNSVTGITISFGFITGSGIGLGYSCVTPSVLKWFHPSKKGMVTGLIVGGFGIAPVYFAPVMNVLLNSFGIEKSMLFMGIAVAAISIPTAQLIKNPPAGYIPPTPDNLKQSVAAKASVDVTWRIMIKTKQFYLLFIMFLLSASVGLMIFGNISKIAKTQIGITDTALLAILVSFLAITNTAGRVLGGLMSDKIGRENALFVVSVLQMLNMVGFAFYQSLPGLIIGIIVVGFYYGTLLSVFPAITADLYGLKNYGTNYGVLYLGWGLAGVVAPIAADIIYDVNGNFHAAYILAAIMMALMVGVNVLYKKANEATVRSES